MYCLVSFGNDLDTLELYDIDKGVFCKLPSLNFLYNNNDICGRCEVLGRDAYVYHVVDKSLIYLLDRGKYIVKGYKEPMASNCMASFPRIIFEEYIDLTIHNTDILESTTLKKYYDRK